MVTRVHLLRVDVYKRQVMERAEDGILHVTVGPQTASVYIAAKNVEEN